MANDYRGVAVTAPTHAPYRKRSDKSAVWFIGMVLRELLTRLSSGASTRKNLAAGAIDGLVVSSFTLPPDTAASLCECFSLTPRYLEQLPFGGAGGPAAIKRAARAIQSGDAEVVACIAGDTADENSFRRLVENFSRLSRAAVYPYASGGPNMVFAMLTRKFMERHGAERADFGKLCVAQRDNALAAGLSLFPNRLTPEDYLAARPIAEPLHLYDCVMPVAGADGFLVMSAERARALGLPYAEILAAAELHNAYHSDPLPTRGGWAAFRDELYAQAGVGPGEMDFLQTYDDYPVVSLMQMENLGFCPPGAAVAWLRETAFGWNGGGLPHNTGGGQLSGGQAGAAGGFLGAVEALRQLSQPDLPNRVPGAKRGLVSGYGMVNFDRCLCSSAVILSRPGTT